MVNETYFAGDTLGQKARDVFYLCRFALLQSYELSH